MEGGGACYNCQTGQAIIYCRFSNPLVFVITTLVQANIYICIIGICFAIVQPVLLAIALHQVGFQYPQDYIQKERDT